MDVLVAGGHGKVALHLLRLLSERGHHARGLIRNADHAPDLEHVGAVPVLCDLETDDAVPHIDHQARSPGIQPGELTLDFCLYLPITRGPVLRSAWRRRRRRH